jgi:hypothetical protein
MKNVSFVTAVLLTVGEVRQRPSGFSIHDVTTALREKVNDGAIGFSDRNQEDANGVETYRVEHNDVKRVFEELLSTGVLLNLDSSFNGKYRVFFNVDSVVTQGVSNLASSPAVVYTTDPLMEKVENYLRNKAGDVTLKQIQSRFKEDGLTCREIYDLLSSWGYNLRGSGATFSTYTVSVSPY